MSAGWFCTGDIGVLDERGWLYLRGREREEINKGGMKIYPADVDAVVERFERRARRLHVRGRRRAARRGRRRWRWSCAAPIRRRCGRLHDWMAQHLAKHQMPKRWYVVDEIPRTSRGKVNRAAVAARCAEPPSGRPARRAAPAGLSARRRMSLRDDLVRVIEESGATLPSDLDDDTSLIRSGMLDSTALFDLALWVEEHVAPGLDLTAFDLAEEWDTIGEAARLHRAARRARL